MAKKEYNIFLKKAEEIMSPYLNRLGLYYDKEIEKFIGFSEYEIILIEFEEFLTDTEIAINFHRYSNCFDKEYSFILPKKNHLYGSRDINFSHWTYYTEGTKEKDKEQLRIQLDRITNEMLEQIELRLESMILTDYPIEKYIREEYINDCEQMARESHPKKYDYTDEWYLLNEESTNKEPWTLRLTDDEYEYVFSRREKLLPYKKYLETLKKRLKKNKTRHQEDAKEYLMRYSSQNFIKQIYKYYFIDEFLNLKVGKYLISRLKEQGFVFVASASSLEDNRAVFYSKELEKEINIGILSGISWYISHSVLVEYEQFENCRIDCKNDKYDFDGCLIGKEIDHEIKVDNTIKKFIKTL